MSDKLPEYLSRFPPDVAQILWAHSNTIWQRTKQQLLDAIDGHLYSVYGQFPQVDELLDDFRAKVAALELIGRTDDHD